MAEDNKSLFDILEDMKALEEGFLIEAKKFTQEYKSKKITFDFLDSIFLQYIITLFKGYLRFVRIVGFYPTKGI